MATELSMNGKKKIETIQKEFSVKFPYLTLILLDKERNILDVSKTLAEVRQSKGDDVSIVASLKVNTLEKKFLTNYGLIVEVAYQKDGQVVMTEPDEQKTLNELNSWCEANGCNKIDYKKNKEIVFSEDFIDKAIAEHNANEDGFDLVFNEIKIGDKIWMDTNLNVSNFSNGDPIFEAKSSADWIKANAEKTPAFCYYNFDEKNKNNYARYYNWYAVIDKRGLAPNGWEIPTIESFDQLFKSIDAKTKLSSGDDFSTWDGLISPALKSTEIWEYEEPTNNDPDAAGTNTSGFNMLGLGFIDNVGIFQLFMEQTYLWVNNPENDNENKSVIFDMSYTGILLGMQTDINNGCQIRCIKKNIQELLNIDPVLEIVKNKLLEYNNEIIVNPYLSPNSLSFKLPFISSDESSNLIISKTAENYQLQFQCFDKNLIEQLIFFKPDVIKKYESGVQKDDLCKNEGELLSSVVDFICLLNRKSLDFGDGTQIYYVGYNKYSKSINGVGQFQVFKGKEANIFSNYDNYEIETQKWMTRNLQTSFFRNGEVIKEAKTDKEWLLAAENKTPAWCYYNNDPANASKYGYLYNWYAINDPRGLAPKGWEIPKQQDYLTFLENLKSRNSGVDFNLTPAGYRLQDSKFNLINQVGFWWTKDEKDENARFASFSIDKPELIFGDGLKTLGLSVICIAESNISQGLQELIDAGIAINLYRNPGMYNDDIYYSESDLKSNISEFGNMFLDHLFAIPFKSYNKEVVDKVFKFLDKQIIVDYKDSMFRASMHHPVIGIYNSKTNELLGIGIGRKNRIFINSTDKTINDQNYKSFSKFDYSNVIFTIVNLLTIAADAQISLMEAIDDGDSESEADYSESLDDAINNLLIAYPNLPNSISDLSPGDF